MKSIFTIFTFIISLNVYATHWLTYFVYFEDDYVQGPWTRADELKSSDYKYLSVETYEDLFGSEEADFVNKVVSKLKEKKPELYSWTYDLSFENNRVIFSMNNPPENLETIKNEVTASFIFNNYEAVVFNIGNQSDTLTIKDLTIPYFDLVSKQITSVNQTQENASVKAENPLTIWFLVSIILNLALIGYLIKRK